MRILYGGIAIFMIVNCCTLGWWRKPVEVNPEPIVISDLVGEKIDIEERDRYGLFTDIDDFVSAAFYDRPKSEKGYKIVLITRHKPYIAYNNEPLTLSMLRDYIEHYDSITILRESFEEKWGIADYDTLGLPITHAEISIVSSMKGACIGTSASLGMLAGCLIGSQLAREERETYYGGDWDVGGIEDQFYGSLIGATIGTVAGTMAGIIMTNAIEKQKRPASLLKIKEMRKPQEIE